MTLENLTLRDMNTLKWAVKNLRLNVKLDKAKSMYYKKEETIDECNRLDEILSEVLFKYFENQ